MSLKSGYKQTEIGIIPEDWEVKGLLDVCAFKSGKAHEPFISELGKFVCVNSKFISTEGRVRKYATKNLSPAMVNDILMVMSDLPNGKALAKAYLADEDNVLAVNQRVCSLTSRGDYPKFLFYILNRNKYFLKFDDGVNQTHLLNKVFSRCRISIPNSVKEQKAIAEALSDVDALINSLEALLIKKRNIQTGVMQELLTGRTRLPGFTSDWQEVRLGDFVTVLKGRGLSWSKISDFGKFPCLLYGELFTTYRQVIHGVKSRTHSDEGIASLYGDVLMPGSTTTTGEDLATASALLQEGVQIGGDVNIIRPRLKTVDSSWLAYRITNCHRRQIGTLTQGITIHHLYGREIASLVLPLPSLKEQEAIAQVFSDIDDEIQVLEKRLTKTRDLKQGMAQELLTGRTRLV